MPESTDAAAERAARNERILADLRRDFERLQAKLPIDAESALTFHPETGE